MVYALTNVCFSMDHPEMKAARSVAEAREIGNQALRDRDVAFALAGGGNYMAAKATANGALQPYLDEAVRLACDRVNAAVDAMLAGPDGTNFPNLGNGGNVAAGAGIALASNMFGPNGARAAIAAPAGNTKGQFKAALLAVMSDENTMAELAHHNAAIVAIPNNPLESQIYSVMRAVHAVLAQKVVSYITEFRGNNNGITQGGIGGDMGGGRYRRDTVRDRLRDAVLAY